jgi:hypothetical protein
MLFLWFLSSFTSLAQPQWSWSIHPEAHFKVLTPFELVTSTREVSTPFDPIVYHQYNGGSVNDSVLSLAVVIDHFQIPAIPDSADYLYHRELFENTVDQILASLDANLIYIDYSVQANRDICIWKASYLKDNGVIRGNLIIAGNQYYGLQAFGLTQHKPEDLMNKFFDSFKIEN